MMVRGVRGATTVNSDNSNEIVYATKELLLAMIEVNDIDENDVASVMFTTTPDLTSAYPAKGARLAGWTRTALMGFQEMAVLEGLEMCIRVLIHWNTPKTLDEIQHVYLRGAVGLRPDLSPKNKMIVNGKEG